MLRSDPIDLIRERYRQSKPMHVMCSDGGLCQCSVGHNLTSSGSTINHMQDLPGQTHTASHAEQVLILEKSITDRPNKPQLIP